jgi:hypothetical protein
MPFKNKEDRKEYNSKYYKENKEKFSIINKKYRMKHKKRLNKIHKDRNKEAWKNFDDLFFFSRRCSSLKGRAKNFNLDLMLHQSRSYK